MTPGRFVVVGLGNIGLRVLWDLYSRGHRVVGVDSSYDAVERARSMGFEAYLGDVAAVGKLVERLGGVDAIVSALPGAIGYSAVEHLIEEGYNVVDVSFFPEDPIGLDAKAKKSGVVVAVDAGVAPGLSNFLVGVGVRRFDASDVKIFVGGISRRPVEPLGLAATWSVEDLIDEYLRPARYVVNGRVESVDPLSSNPGRLEIPGIGMLEYFPTDGLRTLLYSYPDMDLMVEYTLRWPGHLDFMRKLSRIGFLSDSPVSVSGCPVRPRLCLAKIIEANLRNVEDMVILLVEVKGGRGSSRFKVITYSDENWSAMAKSTGSFQAAVAELIVEADLQPGLLLPEKIGEDPDLSRRVGGKLAERLVAIVEEPVSP